MAFYTNFATDFFRRVFARRSEGTSQMHRKHNRVKFSKRAQRDHHSNPQKLRTFHATQIQQKHGKQKEKLFKTNSACRYLDKTRVTHFECLHPELTPTFIYYHTGSSAKWHAFTGFILRAALTHTCKLFGDGSWEHKLIAKRSLRGRNSHFSRDPGACSPGKFWQPRPWYMRFLAFLFIFLKSLARQKRPKNRQLFLALRQERTEKKLPQK